MLLLAILLNGHLLYSFLNTVIKILLILYYCNVSFTHIYYNFILELRHLRNNLVQFYHLIGDFFLCFFKLCLFKVNIMTFENIFQGCCLLVVMSILDNIVNILYMWKQKIELSKYQLMIRKRLADESRSEDKSRT